jgi:hypothetical protein
VRNEDIVRQIMNLLERRKLGTARNREFVRYLPGFAVGTKVTRLETSG